MTPLKFFIRPGKTLLAKAVANQTSATFLRVVGSELIQKYLVCILGILVICSLTIYSNVLATRKIEVRQAL